MIIDNHTKMDQFTYFLKSDYVPVIILNNYKDKLINQ